MTIVVVTLVSLGVFFMLMGAIGMIKFPDFYSRMHAAGVCDTLGSLLLIIGLACYEGFEVVSAKLLFIALFIFVTSPTATHAIAQSAIRNKVPIWTQKKHKKEAVK